MRRGFGRRCHASERRLSLGRRQAAISPTDSALSFRARATPSDTAKGCVTVLVGAIGVDIPPKGARGFSRARETLLPSFA